MRNDGRELLTVLKADMTFLEQGGYRNAPTAQWRPQFVFEDSSTCLNFDRTKNPRPCRDCVMTTLVPSDCVEIDLSDGEVVGGPPVSVNLLQLLGRERRPCFASVRNSLAGTSR
jgi:hypothetical protein